MVVNTNNLISITEANQNFSQVARTVDEKGPVLILKNNKPRYLLINIETIEINEEASNEKLEEISKHLINQNFEAYKKLAE